MENTVPKPDIESDSEESEDNAMPMESDPAAQESKSYQDEKIGETFFNDDIRVFYNEPLKQLDKGRIKAFRASGKNKAPRDLFALVCEKSLTPRTSATVKYVKIINPNMAKLIASGKFYWPPAKAERFVFIYENTMGVPILRDDDNGGALGWRPEDVLTNVAYPMIHVLMDLRDKDLVHGEIWPGNMYSSGTSGGDKVKLGECLAAPVSCKLPVIYEPIERALADPLGRGMGAPSDDLYAFGVSLAVMLRKEDPLEGMSSEKIIEQKIDKGSYSTLVGELRLRGAMLELLRGLLYDDPVQRWDLDDVQAWMDGRRLSPKQSPKRVKATRPIILGGKKYTRPELLAKDMHKHPAEMVKLVENGEFYQWIERAIEDKSIKARIDQVMQDIASFDRGAGYDERMCVALSTTLYTECPVRYKSLSFVPYGFGKMLSAAYIQKKDLQPYVDVLRHAFVIQSIRHRRNTDTSAMLAKFDSCRAFVSQTSIQSGIERCIYFLDPECPCLSPTVDNYYVRSPEDLMDALEGVCEKSNPPYLFDRHVVSFLSVKDRKNIDPYMADISSDVMHRRMLGQLRTFATIQKRSRLGKFPALADWMSRNLDSVYERFHDQKKRESFKNQVDKAKKAGDLTRLALLFDDPKLYHGDLNDFYQAMHEYKRIDHEKNVIEEKLRKKDTFGQRAGRQMASLVSMGISMAAILVISYFMLINR